MTEYVYGIVDPSADVPSRHGIGDSRLRLIGGDGAAALVSDLLDGELRLGREELLTHVGVLNDALANGTVLPMRFGMVMEDAEEVHERLLEAHAPELEDQLRRLAGKFEARVRATYNEDTLMREVVREDREIAELREAIGDRPADATYYERIRLGELVAGSIDSKREIDAGRILDALSLVSVAAEVAPPPDVRVALSASFLIERQRAHEFDDVLEALAEAQTGRIRFKYTGPLPPHSFVELSEGP